MGSVLLFKNLNEGPLNELKLSNDHFNSNKSVTAKRLLMTKPSAKSRPAGLPISCMRPFRKSKNNSPEMGVLGS
jgi:hypothetical protein